MNAVAFDTHSHVKRLIGAGLTEAQAEAVVETVKPSTEMPDVSQLATKDELRTEVALLRSDLKTEVAALRGDIRSMRGELIWWIIGTGVVSSIAHYFLK